MTPSSRSVLFLNPLVHLKLIAIFDPLIHQCIYLVHRVHQESFSIKLKDSEFVDPSI